MAELRGVEPLHGERHGQLPPDELARKLGDGDPLVTGYDCPSEEITAFTLLDRDRDLRARSIRHVGAMHDSYLRTGLRWIDGRRFGGDCHLRITIRAWGIPFLRPRLAVTTCARSRPAAATDRPPPLPMGQPPLWRVTAARSNFHQPNRGMNPATRQFSASSAATLARSIRDR